MTIQSKPAGFMISTTAIIYTVQWSDCVLVVSYWWWVDWGVAERPAGRARPIGRCGFVVQ